MISKSYNCYTRLYKRKLENEFGKDFVASLDVSECLYPLVYACLKHRRIPCMKRKVFVAKNIEESFLVNPKWKLLKKLIELGEDINNYISKKSRVWSDSDYLLYSCGVYHIHLRSSIKGGVGDDLIYAVVKNDSFFVIHYGNHHDIFKPGDLIRLCEKEWPGMHFSIQIDEQNSSVGLDDEFFKRNACDPRLGFNLFRPASFIDEATGEKKFISNHQNTAMINFESEDRKWSLPFKCVMAFDYEQELMYKSFDRLHYNFGVYPDSLELDRENRVYIFKVPTLNGYGDYKLIKLDAPRQLTISFPSDDAEINWQL